MYLSDSFANLPSPVNETQNLKQLFKPKDNEEELNKNGQRKPNHQESNVEIRIEGKLHPAQKEAAQKKDDGVTSEERKAQAKIDVRDLERVVFDTNYYAGATNLQRENKKGD